MGISLSTDKVAVFTSEDDDRLAGWQQIYAPAVTQLNGLIEWRHSAHYNELSVGYPYFLFFSKLRENITFIDLRLMVFGLWAY